MHLLLFGVKVGLALINGYSRQQPRQSNTFTLLLYFATFQVPRKMLIEAVLVLSRPGSAGVSQRAVEGCVTIRLSAPSFSFTFFYYLSCVFNIVCSPCPSSHTSTTSRVCSRYLGSAYSHARVGLALKQVKIKYSHLFLLACLHPPFPFFSFPPPPRIESNTEEQHGVSHQLAFPPFSGILSSSIFILFPSFPFIPRGRTNTPDAS